MWSYDTRANNWHEILPNTYPNARASFGMAYDSLRDKVVLFGGGNDTLSNETWIFDPTANTWTNANPVVAPPGRYHPYMVYDTPRDKVLLFFGFIGFNYFGDVWSYDPAVNLWTNITEEAAPPLSFYIAGTDITYDSIQNRVIFVGPWNNNVSVEIFDPATKTWTNSSPPFAPPHNYGIKIAFDSASNQLVLLLSGGRGIDTWTYDLVEKTWAKMNTWLSPRARSQASVIFDAATNRVVLVGGYVNGNYVADLYLYDPATNQWDYPKFWEGLGISLGIYALILGTIGVLFIIWRRKSRMRQPQAVSTDFFAGFPISVKVAWGEQESLLKDLKSLVLGYFQREKRHLFFLLGCCLVAMVPVFILQSLSSDFVIMTELSNVLVIVIYGVLFGPPIIGMTIAHRLQSRVAERIKQKMGYLFKSAKTPADPQLLADLARGLKVEYSKFQKLLPVPD